MSAIKLYFILSVISIVAVAIVGILLLFIKVISQPNYKKHKTAMTLLGSTMIVCAFGRFLSFRYVEENIYIDIFSWIILIVAQLQACMFTFMVLIMLQSKYVTIRNIVKNLVPTVLFAIIYFILIEIFPDEMIYSMKEYHINIPLMFRTLFALIYAIQVFIYVKIFIRERSIAIMRYDDYSSDFNHKEIKWISQLFWNLLVIGVIVLYYLTFPEVYISLFVEVYLMVIYIMFAISFINYQHSILQQMCEYVVAQEPDVKEDIDEFDVRILEMLNEKLLFLNQGVLLADYAALLNIPERKLSAFIKSHFGCNFNNWINEKRIQFACKLLEDDLSLTIDKIAQDVGFSDKSNFSKTFKKIKGISFLSYKKLIKTQ